MNTVKFIILGIAFVLTNEKVVSQNSQLVDSLQLEKAFQNKNPDLVKDLFDRWHFKDLQRKNEKNDDTTNLLVKIYEVLLEKFLQKELAGYYAYNDPESKENRGIFEGICKFNGSKSPYLLLQDKITYSYSSSEIDSSDFLNYINWRTNFIAKGKEYNGDTKKIDIIDGKKSKDTSLLVQFFTTSSFVPESSYLMNLERKFKSKPIIIGLNSQRQKVLSNFIGYKAIGPGYRYIAEESPSYKSRNERSEFLNSVLSFEDQLIDFVAGNYAFEITNIEFFSNNSYALAKYRVGACVYRALVDLHKLSNENYVPMSIYKAIE